VPGSNVLSVGIDVSDGALVLEQGTTIGSCEVALLATVGHARMKVHRRPVVAVLSTGDELVEPGEPLSGAKIRDSNRYGLMAAIAEAGGVPLSMGSVPDDPSEQERRIREAIARSDVVLTSGGVSVGSRDLIKPILERLGTVHFGRVAIKPGKPLTFATVDRKLVFGLPGFPVSSLVTFELFVRPTLLQMQGCRHVRRSVVQVELEHELRGSPDRVEFQRGVVTQKAGRLVGRANGRQASSRVLSLLGANALLRIEPNTLVPPGGTVQALLLAPIISG
jgi:molybdopterin molybdotransferase